jgi:hypothetical protein
MASKKQRGSTEVTTPKRNLVARAGARSSAGPMKDKRKLSRQEQTIRDRKEIDTARSAKDSD